MCRSTSVAPLTPTYHIWSPTGDKPWYLHRGKLAAALHHTFHLGFTNEGREAMKRATCRLRYCSLNLDLHTETKNLAPNEVQRGCQSLRSCCKQRIKRKG